MCNCGKTRRNQTVTVNKNVVVTNTPAQPTDDEIRKIQEQRAAQQNNNANPPAILGNRSFRR